MLIKVKALDYNAHYGFAPPQVDALVNTDDIVSVKPTEARGFGPFLLIRFRDGSQMTICGTIDDILDAPKASEPGPECA